MKRNLEFTFPLSNNGEAVYSDSQFHVTPTIAAAGFIDAAVTHLREVFPNGCRHRLASHRQGDEVVVCVDLADDAGQSFSFHFVPAHRDAIRNMGEIKLTGSAVDVPVWDAADAIALSQMILAGLSGVLEINAEGDYGASLARLWFRNEKLDK